MITLKKQFQADNNKAVAGSSLIRVLELILREKNILLQ
jgi:hypothetical protein